MPKAKRRKKTSFKTACIKSVFLYGEPNKGKCSGLADIQEWFRKLVNQYIQALAGNEAVFLQIVKNDKKDRGMRSLEKEMRKPGVSSAYCQNAFDMAVTHLSNRLDTIRIDLYAQDQTAFTQSKVLFAMSTMGKSQQEMAEAMASISRKPGDFYDSCRAEIQGMDPVMFHKTMTELKDRYAMRCLEYKVPELDSVQVPLDSRLMRLEESKDIKAPYVIFITDPWKKGKRIAVPLTTSRRALLRIRSGNNRMAGAVSFSVTEGGKLKVTWACERKVNQPATSRAVGVDTGITDAFYSSDGKRSGSMGPAIQFYQETVEPLFGEMNKLREKKKKIRHYLHAHPDLPEDVGRSLIQKMDRLEHMMQTMDKPYRKARRYYGMLDHAVAEAVDGYMEDLGKDTLTVLERLDIREFNKSRKANGMMSTFARGKLQKRLMEQLNWNGYDFTEVEPAYTSQACPVCSCVDKANRNGKSFKCTCCGHEDDADHNASVNIRERASDREILELSEKFRYSPRKLQEGLKGLYDARNREYKKKHSLSESVASSGAA